MFELTICCWDISFILHLSYSFVWVQYYVLPVFSYKRLDFGSRITYFAYMEEVKSYVVVEYVWIFWFYIQSKLIYRHLYKASNAYTFRVFLPLSFTRRWMLSDRYDQYAPKIVKYLHQGVMLNFCDRIFPTFMHDIWVLKNLLPDFWLG